MNKKSICVAIASLLYLGGITACSEIEAKANGKKKRDYDTTNNVELAAYLGQEITYNGIHFSLDESPEEEHHFKMKVFSTNEEIESYDVVEAYTCNLNGKLYRDIIISPITFTLKPNKVTYCDLGFIYVGDFYRGYSGEDDFSSVDELRIIGENANLTFHMWNNGALKSNGKNVDDYNCKKNIIRDASVKDRLDFKVDDGEIAFEAFPVNKAFLNNTLCIQGVMWEKQAVDIVEVYATDRNDENRVNLTDKPLTMDFDNKVIVVTYCIDDVSKEYYKLCDGYIRYHIITNYFTAIFQTYDYFVNGKTIDDYDLSNLQEYENDCRVAEGNNDFAGPIRGFGENNEDFVSFNATIFEKTKLVRIAFIDLDKSPVETIDVIKAYLTDGDGNVVREYLSTPVTLHEYIDVFSGSGCYFKIEFGDSFDEYYALCKNNIYIFVVTNLGILKLDLIDYSTRHSKQYGEFVDISSEELASYNNLETIDASYSTKIEFSNKHIISIKQKSIFGLPYQYTFRFENYNSYMNDVILIFDAYYTDENGENKIQIFDKAYRRAFNEDDNRFLNALAPEFSYFLNADYKVVLHLCTNWGIANFYLDDIFFYSDK